MDEQTLKNEIRTAYSSLPGAPAALVERTVLRARAIAQGREAERTLAEKSETLSAQEKTSLAAQSVVGRLMLTNEPPENAENMAERLAQEPSFASFASLPPEEMCRKLRSGAFLKNFAPKKEKAEKAEKTPLVRKKTPPVIPPTAR